MRPWAALSRKLDGVRADEGACIGNDAGCVEQGLRGGGGADDLEVGKGIVHPAYGCGFGRKHLRSGFRQ